MSIMFQYKNHKRKTTETSIFIIKSENSSNFINTYNKTKFSDCFNVLPFHAVKDNKLAIVHIASIVISKGYFR